MHSMIIVSQLLNLLLYLYLLVTVVIA